MFQLGLLVVGMFLLQAALSGLQMRHFSKEFVQLRRRGKVACGRKSGGFHAGAIVMFLLDEYGVIREGRQMCWRKRICPSTGKISAKPFWTPAIPTTNLYPVK